MSPERRVARRRRLRPPRLRLTHRCAAVLVDLHHEATGVVASHEPQQAFRAAEDDRVGIGPGLDREALGELLVEEKASRFSFRLPVVSISPAITRPLWTCRSLQCVMRVAGWLADWLPVGRACAE